MIALRERMLNENQWNISMALYTAKNTAIAKKIAVQTEGPRLPQTEFACATEVLV